MDPLREIMSWTVVLLSLCFSKKVMIETKRKYFIIAVIYCIVSVSLSTYLTVNDNVFFVEMIDLLLKTIGLILYIIIIFKIVKSNKTSTSNDTHHDSIMNKFLDATMKNYTMFLKGNTRNIERSNQNLTNIIASVKGDRQQLIYIINQLGMKEFNVHVLWSCLLSIYINENIKKNTRKVKEITINREFDLYQNNIMRILDTIDFKCQ